MNALELKGLSKSFSGFQLQNLNLTLPSGCIMGLIGENGAGKSTTIKLILDMIHKDSGTITLLGQEQSQALPLAKDEIGVVMDDVSLSDCMNAMQCARFLSHVYRHWEMDTFKNLLKKLSVPEKKPIKNLSRGTKVKLNIAVALSHNAKLLLLDEPTNGLDPVVRDEVVSLLNEFTRDPAHSILISSHIVCDLEKLCDYVAFLHEGRLLLCEEKDELLSRYSILRCAPQQLDACDPNAILHITNSPYGVEAVVLRDKMPNPNQLSPISLEELFVCMIKEAI